MSKAKTERTFTGTRKGGATFEVVTSMSDAECLALLATIPGKFSEDCAFEVGKLKHEGVRPKATLIAWGFRIAEEKAHPPKGITFDPKVIGAFIKARRPLRFTRDGMSFDVGFCGPASKYSGSYRITNGQPYGSPDQAFYGYITPSGEWKPTRAASPEVVNAVVAMLTSLGQ